MPLRNDLGVAFHTVREINVSAIREEAERSVAIPCFGAQALYARANVLLREQGDPPVAPGTPNPLLQRPLTTAAVDDWRLPADMALVLLDTRTLPTGAEVAALARLAELSLPTTLVLVGNARSGEYRPSHSRLANAHMITLPALDAPSARDSLAAAIFERLPADKHLAAARALPGLRHVYANELISSVSFANASYALASAIPEQIPLLAAPLAVADIIVLTKNQALMVYRLALAHGAAPDDYARLAELIPVIGGGFVWRQIARTAVSLAPLWGIVPKVAIAYAGTYVTGFAAWHWFVNRERLSAEHLRELSAEAMQRGREYAQSLVESWSQRKAVPAPRRENPGEARRS
ncbi:MAG: hypothetical protein RMK84_10455 [Oscillochloridaceae bacterium]|nr:hypothetical protein [Chloroflexaceae bacterium]MDW8390533.1 hypothetical protein [Oscillochloridaceae bacterium]